MGFRPAIVPTAGRMLQSHRRRLLALAATILITPLSRAQQKAMPRVGLLWVGSTETMRLRTALLDGLRDLGYVEGKTLFIDDRTSVERYEQLSEVAAELVRLRPKVVVVYGGTATQALRKLTTTVPLVMVTGTNPVSTGFVASLSRPGGNITGLTTMSGDTAAKRLELLKQIVPKMRRVAIMISPLSKVETEMLHVAKEGAVSLGLEAYVAEIRNPVEFEPAFIRMTEKKVDALMIVGSTLFQANRKRIVDLALRHRLPTAAVNSDYVEVGALLGYGTDFAHVFRLAAGYVAKILKGASPADMPFEQVSKLELVINMKTAKALGLTVPQAVLIRADRVIE